MPIHIFKDSEGFKVWSDTDDHKAKDGRCIGTASTFHEAKSEALDELLNDMNELCSNPQVIEEAK